MILANPVKRANAMRRGLASLCLFGVLGSPWLGQAEAAEALARSLSELYDPGVVESTDVPGCESLAPGGLSKTHSSAEAEATLPSFLDALVPPACRPPDGPGVNDARRHAPLDRPPPTHARRLALLQLLQD